MGQTDIISRAIRLRGGNQSVLELVEPFVLADDFLRTESTTPPNSGFSAAWLNGQLQALKAAGGGVFELHPGLHLAEVPIVVPWGVHLRGAGVLATEIRAAFDGAALITNEDPGDRFLRISDLGMHANKAEHAIVAAIALTIDDSGSPYDDGYWTLDHLLVREASGTGIVISGRGEGYAAKVDVRDCGGIGFDLHAPDCTLHHVRVSGSGLQGIRLGESNTTLTNCKSFYNGLVDGSAGDGFHIASGAMHNTLAACESQDNNRHGAYIQGDHTILAGFIADSNNAGHEGDAERSANGVQIDGASYCQVTATCRDRNVNTHRQRHALGMANGAEGLRARLSSEGNLTGHIENGWHTNIDLAVNSYGGVQERTYSATLTPNPTLGNYVIVAALTGNITINAPAATNSWTGAELTFELRQDGTGSRVVTFDAGADFGYLATFTLDTDPSHRGTVTFRYQGEHWAQIASVPDLTVPA